MKKLLLILISIAFTSIGNAKAVLQTEAEISMQSGNTLYQNGDFEGAVAAYKNVIELGYESAALYYNLGNSYFRLNNLGKAILNYERALKIEPGDEDAAYNLKIAQARTVDKIQVVPKIFISEWWDVLVTGFSVAGWGLVFVILYVLLILFIGIYFLTRSGRIQRIAFYFGSINLAVVLFVLVVFISSYNREATVNYGILIEDAVSAKQSPNLQSSDAFVIHEGVKFEIEETLNSWAKIRLADGKIGWLPDNSYEGI